MTISLLFRKSLIFAAAGHFTIFTIFSLSFGRRVPSAESYARISFWGDFLHNYQVAEPLSTGFNLARDSVNNIKIIRDFFRHNGETANISKVEKELFTRPQGYIKPSLAGAFGIEKSTFVKKVSPVRYVPKSAESSIVFHPVLPYNFTLYFKDRQVAHVELRFNIVSSAGRNSIDIKRKVTSGNPEVDLLTMRNISHYLSLQQTRFSPNSWQTVKIDLSGEK